jgi:hypothetical protein
MMRITLSAIGAALADALSDVIEFSLEERKDAGRSTSDAVENERRSSATI